MTRRLLGLLAFAAISTCGLAAGTPVAGDVSTAAVTAGINLSTSAGTHLTPKAAAKPGDVVRRLDTRRLQVVLAVVLLLVVGAIRADDRLSGARSVARRIDRARRGPPALL
jgi:hypothetical protein